MGLHKKEGQLLKEKAKSNKSSSNDNLRRKEKHHNKKSRRLKHTAFCMGIGLFSVMAVLGSAFLIMTALGKAKLQRNTVSSRPVLESVGYEEIMAVNNSKNTENESALLSEADETKTHSMKEQGIEEVELEEGWVTHQGEIYEYNESIINLLIMAVDKENETEAGVVDAQILMVIDRDNKTVKMIGISSNLSTELASYDSFGRYVESMPGQIGEQYAYGDGGILSCESTQQSVSKLLYNLPIHGYCAIELETVKYINDAVGGVELTALEQKDDSGKIVSANQSIRLDGNTALAYITGQGESTSGLSELKLMRQKQYLTAFMGQAITATKKNIKIPVDIYSSLSSYMTTNITAEQAAYLAVVTADCTFHAEDFYILPSEMTDNDGVEAYQADQTKLYELIIQLFYKQVES